MHSEKASALVGPLTIVKKKKTTHSSKKFHHIIKGLGGKTKESLNTELKCARGLN
jgi:hypothetical protein